MSEQAFYLPSLLGQLLQTHSRSVPCFILFPLHLRPQPLLVLVELLLALHLHLLHEPLLPQDLFFLHLPEPALLLDLNELDLLLELLLSDPLLNPRSLSQLLHLLGLLLHSLPEELAAHPLLLVFAPPPLLGDAVPVLLLPGALL